MSIFLDANILLEVLLPGRKNVALAERYLTDKAVVSPLTAHLYAYFGSKEGFSIGELIQNLANLRYTDLGPNEINWAIINCQDNDFEDALQVACAITSGAKEFITFDKKLSKNYQKYKNTS